MIWVWYELSDRATVEANTAPVATLMRSSLSPAVPVPKKWGVRTRVIWGLLGAPVSSEGTIRSVGLVGSLVVIWTTAEGAVESSGLIFPAMSIWTT